MYFHSDHNKTYYESSIKENTESMAVFIHGYGEDSSVWESIIAQFKINNMPYLYFDLIGSGKSSYTLTENTTISFFTHEIKKLLDHLNLKNIFLFGHSMGGYIALDFANTYPNYLLGISLLYSSPFADSDEKKDTRIKSIEHLKNHTNSAYLKTLVNDLFAENYDKKLVQNQFQRISYFENSQLIAYLNAMKLRHDYFSLFKNLNIKKQWILGKFDALISLKTMIDKASEIDNLRLEIDFNSGHMGMIENPSFLFQKISTFITK